MTDDWADGPISEVAPDVFRIPLTLRSDALRAVNCYVIAADGGAVLIDPGWQFGDEGLQPELLDGLRGLNMDVGSVRRILVTHVHRDHYTQAASVREKSGAPLALGAKERPSLEMYLAGGGTHMQARLSRLRSAGAGEMADSLVAQGIMRASSGLWEYPDEWLAGGQVLVIGDRTLEVVHTPGHTRGHVCFYDAEAGLVFAGDHVLPHITPSIGFEPDQNRRALADYLDSLRRILALPDAALLPAHGPPGRSAHERTRAILDHHDQRLQLSLEAVRDGRATAFEVAQVLPWTRRGRNYRDLGERDQMLAVSETAAHLDVLHEWRLLDAEWHDGVCRFRPGPRAAAGGPGRWAASA